MFMGSLDGSRVCIKRVRVYSKDGPKKTTKVHQRTRRISNPPPLTELTDLLPRSHDMETIGAPKRRAAAGRHYRSLPAYFKLDAWR